MRSPIPRLLCLAILFSIIILGDVGKYEYPTTPSLPLEYWTWGSSEDDFVRDIILEGNSFYVSGTTTDSNSKRDAVILKWDSTGELEWFRIWGGDEWDELNSIFFYNETLYSCGSTSSYGAGNSDLLLIKWDANGTQLWNKTWGTSNIEHGYEIRIINDSIYTSGIQEDEILLIKWDCDGNVVWSQVWGIGSYEQSYGGLCVDEDGIYLSGIQGDWSESNTILQKWAHNGTLLWTKICESQTIENVFNAWSSLNRVYTVGSSSNASYNDDLIIIAWDKNGTILWNSTWDGGHSDTGMGIWGDESSLYVSGHSLGYGNSDPLENSIVLRFSLNGQLEAVKSISSRHAFDLVGKEDSLYVVGHKHSSTTGTDIIVHVIPKDFQSDRIIPGYQLLIIALISSVTIVGILRMKKMNIKKF